MRDLCWLQGGPHDGEVIEAEMGAYIEIVEGARWDQVSRYQPFTYTPDGILCRWVP